jgi:DNA-binding PadR family transcriptional regulator
MTKEKKPSEYLPLTEATYYIMATLVKPLHGYGVMQEVEILSEGAVTIGPGTLYGVFSTLETEKLIKMVREEGRRKEYLLTEKGRAVLQAQLDRLREMVQLGHRALGEKTFGESDENQRDRKEHG